MLPNLERNVLLPGERNMKAGRHLDGRIWLDIGGHGRIDLRPDQAFRLAKGLLELLGVNVEFEYDGPMQ